MEELILSSVRISVPILFAALAGLLCERSGVANIALEGKLLLAAFASAAAVAATNSLWLGFVISFSVSFLAVLLFSIMCVYGKGDHIVIGTGFNLLISGAIPLFSKSFFGSTGSTPTLPLELRFQNPYLFFILAIVFVLTVHWLMKKSSLGIRITAAGNSPLALVNQGISYKKVRMQAVLISSVLTGLGGLYLSLVQSSGYTRNMSGGRGYLALAALIFGAWKPLPTFAACMFFAFADALQMKLQGMEINGSVVPNQFVQIFPFVVTLFALVLYARKIKAPRAINQDFL